MPDKINTLTDRKTDHQDFQKIYSKIGEGFLGNQVGSPGLDNVINYLDSHIDPLDSQADFQYRQKIQISGCTNYQTVEIIRETV